jgi:general L-amino acid transport system permease protein
LRHDDKGAFEAMSGATADPRLIGTRAAPRKALRLSWSDPVFRAIFWQVVIVGIIVLIAWYLIGNTSRNLAARHIATGFAFLGRVAGIPIGESPIAYNPAVDTYGTALIIGILNTLRVAAVGIVLATILGTLIGIGRLSSNWLLARLTAFYVETLRDIPVLLQLFFWYSVLQAMPPPRQSWHVGQLLYLSNRGARFAELDWDPAYTWTLGGLILGVVLTFAWSRIARQRQDATGRRPPVWPVGLCLMIGLPLAIWALLGAPFQPDMPVLRGFNFQGGGTVSPEYFALLLGLSIYTAAYIAEIVRSGIQSVPLGQWEAAGALGLRRGNILRRIVLPQALRVIIPPMTSQYLNITKNSSLAVAIGFQDIVSIAYTTLNQTGQAIEGVAIIMAVYLTISLSISLFMNWYNARIALVER